jgi:hypothetical protein
LCGTVVGVQDIENVPNLLHQLARELGKSLRRF